MYNKILVPLDGSELSECSLEHAKTIARGCNATEVDLLTVVEKPLPIFTGSRWDLDRAMKQSEKEEQEAEEVKKGLEDYLANITVDLEKEGIAAKTTVIQLTPGDGIADAILEHMQNNNVDLIIMSTHGRSGISRWTFGSVANKVVTHATVPVMTITPAGCRIH